MKTHADITLTNVCSWTLAVLLGLLLAETTEGAALQLRAQMSASVPLAFPVAAEITLENADNQPVVIEDFVRPHVLQVEITRVSTGAIEYEGFVNPPLELDERQLRAATLAPGQGSAFGTVLAAKWGPEKQPLEPVFTSTGLFSIRFTYPVMRRENEATQLEYVRSSPVTLLVTNVLAEHQAALKDVRAMPHVVWLLQPKSADRASPAESAAFEASLRQLLSKHPDSPWAGLARFALASRLYAKFVRAGHQPPALGQEITNLLHGARASSQFYRDDVAQLLKRMERISSDNRSRAKSKAAPPASAQAVQAQFAKLLEHMARGETNSIAPLLVPEFRSDGRLNASDWLAKLKREHDATAPFPMAAHFKTVSITGPEDETVLTAEVTFTSGGRRSVRRVAAFYQLVGKTWLLTSWRNVGDAEP